MNADAPNGSPTASAQVGETLRAAREQRQWSRAVAGAQARLDPGTVSALEAGDLQRLGAPVFVKGHLRLYAEALGLDPEPLLRALQDELATAVPPSPRATPRSHRTQFVDGSVAVRRSAPFLALCVVAVAGVSVWRLMESPVEPVPVSEPSTGVTAALPADAADGAAQPAAATAGRLDTLQVRHAAPLSSALAAGPLPAAEETDAPADAEPRLSVHFTAECWTEITDATGRQVFYGLGRAGETVELDGEPPLRVLFGNAGAARLEYDGELLSWPGAGTAGAVARFDLGFSDGRPVVSGR